MTDEIQKIYTARIICSEMLNDRGYDIDSLKNKIILPMKNFRELYHNNDIDLYVKHKIDKSNKLYLKFFRNKKKINESDLKRESSFISEKTGHGSEYNGEPNIIMVSREKPPSNVYNIIGTEKYQNIEIFILNSLQFNPTKHCLVPKHSRMTLEEQKNILQFYKCERKELPKLSVNDPIAKYYGMKIGEICKIERVSETTGFSNFYRHVK